MKIIIAGAGKVGYMIAKHLMFDNDVTVIDKNEEAIKKIQENLDVLAICGDIENPHTYHSIDANNIDLFIAVTDSDEVNIISSLIIDNISRVEKKIIRLKNSFFANDLLKERLGIDEFVVPAFEAAQPFKYLVDFPHARNVKAFDYTKALLVSIKVDNTLEPILISKLLEESNGKLVIAGIERKDDFFVPTVLDLIMPDDLVYVYAYPSAIKDLRFNICCNHEAQQIKNCTIFGADSLGLEIAKILIKKDIEVQIVDKDLQKCKRANTVLKDKATVIKSTYDSDHMLGYDSAMPDMFISASRNDEYNITKCMEARYSNIEKVVAINNDIAYSKLMRQMNLEAVRGEKINAFYSILERIESSKIVIKRKYCAGEGILLLRKIFPFSELVGEYLKLPNKIADKGSFYIQRDGSIFPYAEIESFMKNDVIIVFSKSENSDIITKWIHQNR